MSAEPTDPVVVYGVVPAGTDGVVGLDGVAEGRTMLIEAGTLAAVVSPLPGGELRARRRDLRAHLDVLEHAFTHGTIVPCRFGTVLDSEDAVREDLLLAERERLLAGLERLRGRVQLRLTVSYDEDAVLREVVVEEPEVARLRAQVRASRGEALYAARIRLGELVAAALEARSERDADAIVAAVAPHVDEVALEEPGAGRVLKASLLVERSKLDAVERRIEALAAAGAGRLRFELLGPLPPTAFASSPEEPAWA